MKIYHSDGVQSLLLTSINSVMHYQLISAYWTTVRSQLILDSARTHCQKSYCSFGKANLTVQLVQFLKQHRHSDAREWWRMQNKCIKLNKWTGELSIYLQKKLVQRTKAWNLHHWENKPKCRNQRFNVQTGNKLWMILVTFIVITMFLNVKLEIQTPLKKSLHAVCSCSILWYTRESTNKPFWEDTKSQQEQTWLRS